MAFARVARERGKRPIVSLALGAISGAVGFVMALWTVYGFSFGVVETNNLCGTVVRFDPDKPGPPVKTGAVLGLRSATQETPQGMVYTVSKPGKGEQAVLFSFNTKTEQVENLGPAAVGTARVWPPMDTCRSAMTSSSADWTLAGARLISSASRKLVTTGPSSVSNSSLPWR